MSGSLLRFIRATVGGAAAAFLLGILRSVRRDPTPPASGAASWPPLTDEPAVPSRSGPVQFVATPEPDDATPAPAEAASGDAWIEPDADGGCPGSHPIKGNAQSKIFHVPGGGSYERTKAERCYCDEASAEADGFRKAKR